MSTLVIPSAFTAADAALVARLDAIAAGLADGAISAARVGNLDNLDALLSSRAARPPAATYNAVDTGGSLAASTVILDTGALAAGEYEVVAFGSISGGANLKATTQLQHRDAANAANVRAVNLNGPFTDNAGSSALGLWPRITLALNERIRIFKVDADGAGITQSWGLFVRAV